MSTDFPTSLVLAVISATLTLGVGIILSTYKELLQRFLDWLLKRPPPAGR